MRRATRVHSVAARVGRQRQRQVAACAWALGSLLASLAARTQAAELPSILVEGIAETPTDETLDANGLAFARISSSDTAVIAPRSDTAQGGGVSGLPMLHGLGDDRVRTLIDGVPIAAACPMHMNPALSYIDPTQVARIDTLPGVTPVSLGGDSIAGTIVVQTPDPTFAPEGQSYTQSGNLSTVYRSNGAAVALAAAESAASQNASLAYHGSGVRADDYQDGDGDRIRASRFEDSDQQLTWAYRRGADLYVVELGLQDMPYEGFPNADMDLSGNLATFVHLRYRGTVAWGDLSISGYYDGIRHQMNGNAPDRYPPSPVDLTSMGLMPTRERGQDFGYRVELDVPVSARDLVRAGSELHTETLDDRWPGAPVGMPFDYVNLNHAARTQLGTFVEWQRRWDSLWSTLVGTRIDYIAMNAGPVQGYDGMDGTAAAFNALNRARDDVNVDASLLALYRPDDGQSYRFGLARKNRSPNLYERYAWGTSTIGMNSFFGDGNGYTGQPSLRPESAYTVSASGVWSDAKAEQWTASLTPYYTLVENYIGVLPLCDSQCSGLPAAQLLFANQTARLYGADASGNYALGHETLSGDYWLVISGGFVRGQDRSTHTELYHMMPLHGTIAIESRQDPWTSQLELQAVDHKDDVDSIRMEPPTPGYAIVNARTAYVWRRLRVDLAVTNLLNRQYDNPLGGTWQLALYPPGYNARFRPLPGAGRSIDVGVNVTL